MLTPVRLKPRTPINLPKMDARLYNPRAYHITMAEAIKDIVFMKQHPLLHTFHPTIVKAVAVAWHILTTGGSNKTMKAALLFSCQMFVIFNKHGVEMLVDIPIPYCQWFAYCNRIAMIGICIKGHVEFYPITFQLWDEEHLRPALSSVAHSTSAEEVATTRDVPQHEEAMPTPWPPIADSTSALDTMARDILQNEKTMSVRSQPFHSCFKCDSNAVDGPTIFVPPEYILDCSSHVPAQHRTDDIHSVNNICPGFVDKFKNLVFKLSSADLKPTNKDAEVQSSGFTNDSDTSSPTLGQQNISSTSSISSIDPVSSGTLKEPAEAEPIPVISMPSPTATNIDRVLADIQSVVTDCPRLNPSRLSSGSAISDGDN